MISLSTSPSRTYVAMCLKSNFDGYYFRKFTLPQYDDPAVVGLGYQQTSEFASWWFLNRLNVVACIEGCIAFEDFQKLDDEVPLSVKLSTPCGGL